MRTNATEQQEAALRGSKDKIVKGRAGVGEARDTYRRNAVWLATAEGDLAAKLTALDPANPGTLDLAAQANGRVATLRLALDRSRQNIEGALASLRVAVEQSREPLLACCQSRCVEEAAIFISAQRNTVLPEHPDSLLAAAENRVREIDIVLSARRGCLLSLQERNDGVLRSGLCGVRRLTADEIQSGIAAA